MEHQISIKLPASIDDAACIEVWAAVTMDYHYDADDLYGSYFDIKTIKIDGTEYTPETNKELFDYLYEFHADRLQATADAENTDRAANDFEVEYES